MTFSVGVICHYGVGGSARIAVDLSRELSARGHAVHLFARSAPFAMRPRDDVRLHALHDRPITTSLDIDWNVADLNEFTNLVCEVARRESLDILHFHYAIPFLRIAQAVQARLGLAAPRMIVTLHGTDVSVYGLRPCIGGELLRGLLDVDVVTTVSRSHAALAQQVLSLPGAPLVVPNFANTGRFRPRPMPAYRRPRIGFVSNFRQIKQPGRMARIVDAAMDQVEAELWLVGAADRPPEVADVLAAREAAGQVRWLGVRLDTEHVMPALDVVLVTSRSESFSLVALEAMACGVPVVAPRVGGIPELVEHGVSGLLFDVDDDEQAARHLVRLVADTGERRRLGRQARERALAFCSTAVIPRYEQLYLDVLREHAGTTSLPVLV